MSCVNCLHEQGLSSQDLVGSYVVPNRRIPFKPNEKNEDMPVATDSCDSEEARDATEEKSIGRLSIPGMVHIVEETFEGTFAGGFRKKSADGSGSRPGCTKDENNASPVADATSDAGQPRNAEIVTATPSIDNNHLLDRMEQQSTISSKVKVESTTPESPTPPPSSQSSSNEQRNEKDAEKSVITNISYIRKRWYDISTKRKVLLLIVILAGTASISFLLGIAFERKDTSLDEDLEEEISTDAPTSAPISMLDRANHFSIWVGS